MSLGAAALPALCVGEPRVIARKTQRLYEASDALAFVALRRWLCDHAASEINERGLCCTSVRHSVASIGERNQMDSSIDHQGGVGGGGGGDCCLR